MQQYTVTKFEDPVFWDALNDFPKKGQEYPSVLTLGGYASFAIAPASILQCYNDFSDPQKALNFTVPATPQPITTVAYLAAPQVDMVRRFFAAFFYAEGQAILAECSFLPLLHQPLGLRIANGSNVAVNRTFKVLDAVLKGDDAPIHMVLVSPSNPEVSLTMVEKVQGEKSVLDISLRAPRLAAMTVNQGALI